MSEVKFDIFPIFWPRTTTNSHFVADYKNLLLNLRLKDDRASPSFQILPALWGSNSKFRTLRTCTRKLSLGQNFCNSYKARRARNVNGTICRCEISFWEQLRLL